MQVKRYGKILKRTRIDRNEVICNSSFCEIVLYNRKQQEVARAKIDKEDLEKVQSYKWSLAFRNAVHGKVGGKLIKLHQLIFGKKEGYEIDHINRDYLDNRKVNLRHCLHGENVRNKVVRGVYWHNARKQWRPYIKVGALRPNLGGYKKLKEAIAARKVAEKKYFGKFAPT